jgi:hypothetical protein
MLDNYNDTINGLHKYLLNVLVEISKNISTPIKITVIYDLK